MISTPAWDHRILIIETFLVDQHQQVGVEPVGDVSLLFLFQVLSLVPFGPLAFDLEEAGFVEETNQGKGNEAKRYKTSLEKATLVFEEGDFSIKIKMEEEKEITEET